MVSRPLWRAEQTRMPKYFLFIDDIKQGYPSAMPSDYGIPETKGIVWVTAPNSFAAESKAMEEYGNKNNKKEETGVYEGD